MILLLSLTWKRAIVSNYVDCNKGEIMRWIAEATLFPFALLPQDNESSHETQLRWTANPDSSDTSAILEFKHNSQTAEMTYWFDSETHLPTTITAKRPRTMGSKTELADWEGHFFDYELHGGLVVPTQMEVGWKTSNKDCPLELYFKGKNMKFIYLMNFCTRHEYASNEMHEHNN